MAKRKNKKVKHNKYSLILTIIILIVLGAGYYFYNNFIKEYLTSESASNSSENNNNAGNIDINNELFISFLELGNQYTGDSIYIKAGENDVLIDAGSRNSSSTAIYNQIKNYVTDGKLEYVIATHAHQDHIAGFVGTKTDPGIFELYDCGTIIDFPKTNATSTVYKNYIEKRDLEIENGAIHYTALECYEQTNGAQKVIKLSDDVTLEILYNYYYDHSTTNENNYSVCVLLKHGNRKFLLTGDLEAEGEEYLVEYNEIGKVDLYKAGHHGSYTAGSAKLLEEIKPDIVCVCCCAGSTEYTTNPDNTFPSQPFISRICKYTTQVYVTTVISSDGKTGEALNGQINVSSTLTGIVVNCSNNNTYLKDSDWFKKNRRWEE